MASSPASLARRPHLLLPLLALAALLLATLPSCLVCAAVERRHSELRATAPAAVAAGRARQAFHVAPVGAGTSANGATSSRRPINARRGRGAGGSGAWTFSAMLPRGFVPPSGSSACHNDMPATAAKAQFFACGGAGTP